jgi:hypothetical protein
VTQPDQLVVGPFIIYPQSVLGPSALRAGLGIAPNATAPAADPATAT